MKAEKAKRPISSSADATASDTPSAKPSPRKALADGENSDTYSSLQVATLAKVSLRQLQWWDEHGLISPKFVPGSGGVGFVRSYSEEDLTRVIRIAQLRKAGVSLQQIRRILASRAEWQSVVRVRKPTVLGTVLIVPG